MSLQLRKALAQVFAEVVTAHSQGQPHGADAELVAMHLQVRLSPRPSPPPADHPP